MAHEFDLYDVTKTHVDKLADQLYTSLPATVTKYYASKQSVDVSIDVRQPSTLDRDEMPLMSLSGVPIIFPSGGGGILSFPIKTGDKVLLCFSMMSIDKWKERGEGVCGDNRLHSNNDGIAIAGLFNLQSNLAPNPDDVELKAFDSRITLKSDGVIEIEAAGDCNITVKGNCNISPSGKTTIDSDLDVTGDINCSKTVTASTDCVGGGKSLKGHTHGGVRAGTSSTTAPN